ncbi:MAG: ChbG/HpnK family deacetylase [Bacteroidales bacterium]|nr:ChbG/HpnK family deacetylase [Bacteroidales bacterium]
MLSSFKVDSDEIFREYCLQIEKVLDEKIRISHLDHHHHHHLYLPSLKAIIKADKKYKIKAIRSQRLILPKNQNVFNEYYRKLHQFYLKRNVKTTDGYFEPLIKNSSDFEQGLYRLSLLLNKNFKSIEIMLHPTDENDVESAFFSDHQIVRMIKKHNLINFHEISHL